MKRVLAFVFDAALVIAFLLISRVSHDRSLSIGSVVAAVSPFLAGLAVGWLVTRSWRDPLTGLSALGVWACTVVGGFLPRLVSVPRPRPADVVVAVFVLGFLLGGWRLYAFLVRSLRERRAEGLPVD